MTPRERLLADIRRLADELPCVGLADGRLKVGVHEARLAGLEPECLWSNKRVRRHHQI